MGSYLEQAPFCAKLARELKCVVLSVDYRTGPIHKHPAALEDAQDVLNVSSRSQSPRLDKATESRVEEDQREQATEIQTRDKLR